MCRSDVVKERNYEDLSVRLIIKGDTYEPSDDTYMIMDAIKSLSRARIALDIGCGSGVLSIVIARKGIVALCVDISPCAVESALSTARNNRIESLVDIVQCDSATCLRSDSVDLVVSNPPYLPVREHHLDEGISWSGGVDGIEIPLRFLTEGMRVCKSNCTIVFVVSSLQKFEALFNELARVCRDVLIEWRARFFFERLGLIIAKGCKSGEA